MTEIGALSAFRRRREISPHKPLILIKSRIVVHPEIGQVDVLSATRSFGGPEPLRFDAYVVVHSATNPLFAAKIALSGLHGDMSKQELNLL